LLDSLTLPGLLGSASLDASGPPSLWYRPFICRSPCDCFQSVARKSFISAALFKELLVHGSCYRDGGHSIRQPKTLFCPKDAHLSYFL